MKPRTPFASLPLICAFAIGGLSEVALAETTASDSTSGDQKETKAEQKKSDADAKDAAEISTDEAEAVESVVGSGGGGGGGSVGAVETLAPARSKDEDDDHVASALDSSFWSPWNFGGASIGGGQFQSTEQADAGGEVLGVKSSSKTSTHRSSGGTVYVSVPQTESAPESAGGNTDTLSNAAGSVSGASLSSGGYSYGGVVSIWNYNGGYDWWNYGMDSVTIPNNSTNFANVTFYSDSGSIFYGSGGNFIGNELVPVPEPTSIGLLAATGLLLVRRRR